MLPLEKTNLKKSHSFYNLDLYLLNALVLVYGVAPHFFTLHQSFGDVCIQHASNGLWTLMSVPTHF